MILYESYAKPTHKQLVDHKIQKAIQIVAPPRLGTLDVIEEGSIRLSEGGVAKHRHSSGFRFALKAKMLLVKVSVY
jgi:hypothetical protein